MLIKTCINIAAHNSFVVQMTVTTYFHVGIWCVLEFGRSPGLSSWLLTPSRPKTVVFVIHSDLQLRDSDGITPFFPIKPSRSLAPILTRYVILNNYNIFIICCIQFSEKLISYDDILNVNSKFHYPHCHINFTSR